MNLPELPAFVVLPDGRELLALRVRHQPSGELVSGYANDAGHPRPLAIELDDGCKVAPVGAARARELGESWAKVLPAADARSARDAADA